MIDPTPALSNVSKHGVLLFIETTYGYFSIAAIWPFTMAVVVVKNHDKTKKIVISIIFQRDWSSVTGTQNWTDLFICFIIILWWAIILSLLLLFYYKKSVYSVVENVDYTSYCC